MLKTMRSRRVVQVVRVMVVLAVGACLVAYAVTHRGSARKEGAVSQVMAAVG